jgi:hypothetical protein
MTTPVNIRDSENDWAVCVTKNGELVTTSASYSEVYQESSADINIHNVVVGRPNKIFVITSAIIAQDKTNTDVNVSLFEADDLDGASTKLLFEGGLTRSDRINVPFLNVATNPTKWINFQHDSATATIAVTLTGYYISA